MEYHLSKDSHEHISMADLERGSISSEQSTQSTMYPEYKHMVNHSLWREEEINQSFYNLPAGETALSTLINLTGNALEKTLENISRLMKDNISFDNYKIPKTQFTNGNVRKTSVAENDSTIAIRTAEFLIKWPNTCLLISCWLGKFEIVKVLLSRGACTSCRDDAGRTPLHLAAAAGALKIIEELLKYGANVCEWDYNRKYTPLHCAAATGDVACVKYLIKSGADVNAGLSNRSPLHYAVLSNSEKCVEILLQSGACPNNPQVYTETPLHVAASLGSASCMRLLLNHGADVKVQVGNARLTPLHLAADEGSAECTKLLLNAGALKEARNSRGQTAMHLAALSQSAETLDVLIKSGAEINLQDDNGRTPLHAAVAKASRGNELVKMLINAGADINKADKFGYMPLHIAALNESSPTVIMLLSKGANVTAKTKGGVSALSFLIRRTPDVLPLFVTYFDQAISLHDHELGDIDCEIRLDFHPLVPYGSQETDLILCLIEVGQKHILRHPLCESFLYLKWLRIRKFFLMSLAFHSIFVAFFTGYIIVTYIWYFAQLSKALFWLTLTFTTTFACKELFQMTHSISSYVKSWENWLQWCVILITSSAMITINQTWQHHIAALGILLSWVELMMVVGRFPTFGLYIQMFTQVSINFFKFLGAYVCLIIGFSLGFTVLHKNYKSFSNPLIGFLKTVVMLSGELEFEDVFFDEESPILYSGTAHLMLLSFVILITIILTNLMVGLAVSDIQKLQRSAGLDRLVRRAQLVSYLENMLFSKLLDYAPKKIIRAFRTGALLLRPPHHCAIHIRPNDPRENRLPRELIKSVYHLVSEKKRKCRNTSKSISQESDFEVDITKFWRLYSISPVNDNQQQLGELASELKRYSQNIRKCLDDLISKIEEAHGAIDGNIIFLTFALYVISTEGFCINSVLIECINKSFSTIYANSSCNRSSLKVIAASEQGNIAKLLYAAMHQYLTIKYVLLLLAIKKIANIYLYFNLLIFLFIVHLIQCNIPDADITDLQDEIALITPVIFFSLYTKIINRRNVRNWQKFFCETIYQPTLLSLPASCKCCNTDEGLMRIGFPRIIITISLITDLPPHPLMLALDTSASHSPGAESMKASTFRHLGPVVPPIGKRLDKFIRLRRVTSEIVPYYLIDMGKKTKGKTYLGKALIRDKFGPTQKKRSNDSMLHSAEINDGYDWNRLNLQSVTEEDSFQEFLSTAELAGTEFHAEKLNIKFINPNSGIGLLSREEKEKVLKSHEENKLLLKIPRKPQWNESTTAYELKTKENEEFLEWRRQLSVLQKSQGLILTPYEKNLEFWRQLWRVVERSDVVVQITDARNPLLFRCEDLEHYVKEIDSKKINMILINKADFLTEEQRRAWSNYFSQLNVRVAFFSALQGLQKEKINEDAMVEEIESSSDQDEINEEDSEDSKEAFYDSYYTSESEYESANETLDICNDKKTTKQIEPIDKNENENETLLFEKVKYSVNEIHRPGIEKVLTEKIVNSPEILTREKLIRLFKTIYNGKTYLKNTTTIGLVGYPNVGKSSTINTLLMDKKVSVSATPGKTKHFQTLYLDNDLLLCDCPGLVMPSFVCTKADMILNGILPIDQMRDHIPSITLLGTIIPRHIIEDQYGLILPLPLDGEDPDRPPTAEEVLNAYGYNRGFMTQNGQPDNPRSARYILKDFVNGKLLYCVAPPSIPQNTYHTFAPRKKNISLNKHIPVRAMRANKGSKITMADIDEKFFQQKISSIHVKEAAWRKYKEVSLQSSTSATGSTQSLLYVEKPWKAMNKHCNKKKREKSRRLYAHLDQH
ncbi:uncharacterized protein [Prorops nasuta]|uniref:uncharacterized protein n=1 Tax=Prorops nasuta TaxID=863751 RepID=UPI0034CFBAD9